MMIKLETRLNELQFQIKIKFRFKTKSNTIFIATNLWDYQQFSLGTVTNF